MDNNKQIKIDDLKRRSANARKRVRYWAGLPSFVRGAGYSTSRIAQQRRGNRGVDHETAYENALADCDALIAQIEALIGHRYKFTDYKLEESPFKDHEIAKGIIRGAFITTDFQELNQLLKIENV